MYIYIFFNYYFIHVEAPVACCGGEPWMVTYSTSGLYHRNTMELSKMFGIINNKRIKKYKRENTKTKKHQNSIRQKMCVKNPKPNHNNKIDSFGVELTIGRDHRSSAVFVFFTVFDRSGKFESKTKIQKKN